MAKITFNKNEVEKEIPLDTKTLEKIMLLGIPIEVLKDTIEIEVLPNRPDLLSLQGFLRAIKSFLGKDSGLKKYKINKPEKDYSVFVDKSVKFVRPYTSCAIVKNLRLDDEMIKTLIDLQEKLHITLGRNRKKLAIGIYPLEKIALPIKYEARNPNEIKFIPLDFNQELSGSQILQKHPAGKEYAHLLENKEKFPVFVDAKGKILSMPPIINSNETGKVTLDTKSVFIECSGFDQSILNKTLNIIITTLSDMGGKIYSMNLNCGGKKMLSPDLNSDKIKISLHNVNFLLGLDLKETQIPKLLGKMGYDFKNGNVIIPPWRTDILHEVDIIEDLAIAFGYDNMTPELPQISTVGNALSESKIKEKISEILIGLELIEISSYHLVKESEKKLNPEAIILRDSKTDYKFLRPNLMIPMLRTISENKDNEYPQKLFELGKVFQKDEENKTDSGINEQTHLCISLTPGNFTEAKRILDYLIKMLDLNYTLSDSKISGCIEGRSGDIFINGKNLGYIAEVHPETLNFWNIKFPVSVIEISLDEIFELLQSKARCATTA